MRDFPLVLEVNSMSCLVSV